MAEITTDCKCISILLYILQHSFLVLRPVEDINVFQDALYIYYICKYLQINCNMLVYEFSDICEKEERHNCGAPKRNRDQIERRKADLVHVVTTLNNLI